MYYRVAWKTSKSEESSAWAWKSTVLSSRDAVCGFLQLFRGAIAPSRFRIFTCVSREGLDEQLMRENADLESTAVTVDVFLGRAHTAPSEPVETVETLPPRERSAVTVQQMSAGIFSHPEVTAYMLGGLPGTGMPLLDQRRLAIERGSGGDADLPFVFMPPSSVGQRLVWVHLLARVHRGELVP